MEYQISAIFNQYRFRYGCEKNERRNASYECSSKSSKLYGCYLAINLYKVKS